MTQSATVTKLAKVWRWVGKVKKHVTTLQKGLRIQGTRNGSIFNIVSPVNGFTNVGWLKLDAVIVTPPPVDPPPFYTDLPRFAWDDEMSDWGYKCRTQSEGWASAQNPPAVLRYYPVRKEGAGEAVVDISAWYDRLVALNGGDEQKVRYFGGESAGQFNQQGWPHFKNVGMCGNTIHILEEIDGWVKFETLKVSDVGAVADMTPEKYPHLIHSFHCVTWDAKTKTTKRIYSTGTNRGVVLYYLITELGFAWIPARNVVKAK